MVSALLCLGILDPAMEGRTDALCLLEKLLTQVLCECDESMSSHGQVDAMLIPWAGIYISCILKCVIIDFTYLVPFYRPPLSSENVMFRSKIFTAVAGG